MSIRQSGKTSQGGSGGRCVWVTAVVAEGGGRSGPPCLHLLLCNPLRAACRSRWQRGALQHPCRSSEVTVAASAADVCRKRRASSLDGLVSLSRQSTPAVGCQSWRRGRVTSRCKRRRHLCVFFVGKPLTSRSERSAPRPTRLGQKTQRDFVRSGVRVGGSAHVVFRGG